METPTPSRNFEPPPEGQPVEMSNHPSGPPHWRDGLLWGSLGMFAFSGTLPATKIAVPVFGPAIITFGRIEVAAPLGFVTLLLTGQLRLPARRHWGEILWMGLGLAFGYPFFVALALRDVPSSHGAVVIGLAPRRGPQGQMVRAATR